MDPEDLGKRSWAWRRPTDTLGSSRHSQTWPWSFRCLKIGKWWVTFEEVFKTTFKVIFLIPAGTRPSPFPAGGPGVRPPGLSRSSRSVQISQSDVHGRVNGRAGILHGHSRGLHRPPTWISPVEETPRTPLPSGVLTGGPAQPLAG